MSPRRKLVSDFPVLKDAYAQARRKCVSQPAGGEARNLGFHQTLVALTDLKDEAGGHGYTREEIENFWSSGQSAHGASPHNNLVA